MVSVKIVKLMLKAIEACAERNLDDAYDLKHGLWHETLESIAHGNGGEPQELASLALEAHDILTKAADKEADRLLALVETREHPRELADNDDTEET